LKAELFQKEYCCDYKEVPSCHVVISQLRAEVERLKSANIKLQKLAAIYNQGNFVVGYDLDMKICPNCNRLVTNIDALMARLEKLEGERRWIPVGERVPEIDVDVWAWNEEWSEGAVMRRRKWKDEPHTAERIIWYLEGGGEIDDYDAITHWQPLPAAPGEALAPQKCPRCEKLEGALREIAETSDRLYDEAGDCEQGEYTCGKRGAYADIEHIAAAALEKGEGCPKK
jgi:hypothetical protein